MSRLNRAELVENALKTGAELFRVSLPIVPREILDLDVTMTQLKILFILFVDGHKRMSDLASDLGITLATASGLVDRMVEREMVIRESQPDDRRVVLCRLSESGRVSISRIWESAANRLRDLLKNLEDGSLRTLTEILQTMLASAGQENQAAKPD